MRYIVIFLVIANLGYFAWQLYFPTPPLPATVSAPRPLLNQGLVLLSEFNLQAAETEQAPAVAARLCHLIGDFSSIDEANSFIRVLENGGYRVALHMAGEPLAAQYRVHLPAASSRESAAITLDGLSERLTGEGLQIETYLITRGTLENAIALGVYPERERAELIQQQVSSLGYSPEIEEIPQSTGPLQIVLAKSDFSALDIAEWLDFAGDRPELTYSENLCETIAQGDQFP